LSVALIRSFAVPDHCLGIILVHSTPVLVMPAEVNLGLSVAVICCLSVPIHNVRRVALCRTLTSGLNLGFGRDRLGRGNVLSHSSNGHTCHAYDQERECSIHDSPLETSCKKGAVTRAPRLDHGAFYVYCRKIALALVDGRGA